MQQQELFKKVLNINAVKVEELLDSEQLNKERKPDFLKIVTDDKGDTFILHVELMTRNDIDMVWRMAEYFINLVSQYELVLRQYVIYMGAGKSTMPYELELEDTTYRYELISISSIDYRYFLRSDKLEEKMLALLGDFGKDDPYNVLTYLITEIQQHAKDKLEIVQRKISLRIFIQLRKLVFTKIKNMESISTFFKDEDDILYQMGEEKGKAEKSREFVKNLLVETDFPVVKIASLVGITEDFVLKVKKKLK